VLSSGSAGGVGVSAGGAISTCANNGVKEPEYVRLVFLSSSGMLTDTTVAVTAGLGGVGERGVVLAAVYLVDVFALEVDLGDAVLGSDDLGDFMVDSFPVLLSAEAVEERLVPVDACDAVPDRAELSDDRRFAWEREAARFARAFLLFLILCARTPAFVISKGKATRLKSEPTNMAKMQAPRDGL